MNESLHLWLIPLLPFTGFLLNGLLGRRLPKTIVSTIALLAPLGSFLVVLLASRAALPHSESYGTWITAGNFNIDFTFVLDQLSLIMLLVITGVGFLIHIYSVGYMHDDAGYWRYFAYLNLFLFFMTTLVLAGNALLMFVGWEGVGLASYLLIGFWFQKKSAADAGKKAFIVNRIGDFGFLIGLFLLLANFGTLSFSDLAAKIAANPTMTGGVLTAIGLCLFVGAAGKSAQLPLYVWLPDAMEGPTPVSALIHAATMVTAGVYMVARTHFIFDRSPLALSVVAIIGAATALFAATIGLVQTDIKRVLAYSTISQLGYMFMGVGAGAFAAGIFHVMTHAFFKGLLFLCAGSIIHGLDGEQDMTRMGALWRRMPITYATMLAATLAITAVPGFSGYFSKDLILERTFAAGYQGLWLIGIVTAGLTALYMFRLLFLTFHGNSRVAPDTHVHESPPVMTVPLIVLGVLSVAGGWVELPDGWLWGGAFTRWLRPVFGPFHTHVAHGAATGAIGLVALLATLIGFLLAHIFYIRQPALPGQIAARASALYRLLVRKYYVDELYNLVFGRFLFWGSDNVLNRGVDHGLIDGIVDGTGLGVEEAGDLTRHSETGNVQVYAFVYLVGAVGIVAYYVYLVMVR